MIRRMSLDRENQVKSFAELGLFDPFNQKSREKAFEVASSFNFKTQVYPIAVTGPLIKALKQNKDV